MVDDNIVDKVLDKLKGEIIGILIDTDNKLQDDITLKNVMM